MLPMLAHVAMFHVEGMFHGMLRLELHANPRSGFQLTSWAVQNMKFARALKNPAFVLLSDQDSLPSHPAVQSRVDSKIAPKADAKRLEALPIPGGEISDQHWQAVHSLLLGAHNRKRFQGIFAAA